MTKIEQEDTRTKTVIMSGVMILALALVYCTDIYVRPAVSGDSNETPRSQNIQAPSPEGKNLVRNSEDPAKHQETQTVSLTFPGK